MLRALQREDLIGFTVVYDNGVHLAHANCAEGFFQIDDAIQKIRG